MALLPNIPTSFVPHPGGSAAPIRAPHNFTGAFGFLAYGIFGFVLLLSIGVFAYAQILMGAQTSKDAQLAKAEAGIDAATVEGFVKLRNRLNYGNALLMKHVAFSNFFTIIGQILPSSVRFTTLHLSLDSVGVAHAEGTGIAKNFNALAAVSSAFASDGRIKDAIFSKISVNKDSSVSFSFSSELDQKLVGYAASVSSGEVTPPAP